MGRAVMSLPIPLPESDIEGCTACPTGGVYDIHCRRCVARFCATLPRPTVQTYLRAIRSRHGAAEARAFAELMASIPRRVHKRRPPPRETPASEIIDDGMPV